MSKVKSKVKAKDKVKAKGKSKAKADGNHVINCADSLDISMVAKFSNELKHALETGATVQLQAANIERADTAALQLLCAFFIDAQEHDIEIEWLEPSDALCGAATQIGLADHLGLKASTLH